MFFENILKWNYVELLNVAKMSESKGTSEYVFQKIF
jgi:hypothetical protein